MEKFCSNCGKPLEKDAEFCPYCGAKQEVNPQAEAAEIHEDIAEGGKAAASAPAVSAAGGNIVIAKLLLSWVIGLVLSFLTFLLFTRAGFISGLLNLALMLIEFAIAGILGYYAALSATKSKGLSTLVGIVAGVVGTFLLSGIFEWWVEHVEGANSVLSFYLWLLPLTLLYMLILLVVTGNMDKSK